MTYSAQQVDAFKIAILDRIADGQSLRQICDDDDMPAASTVFLWLAKDAEFSEQYAHAREAQADAIVDEILLIADDGRNDWMERKNGDGKNIGWQENGEALRRSQLRIDARKWLAGKMKPKKYGDKVDVSHSGKVDSDVTHHGEVAVRPFAEFLGEAIGRGATDIPGGMGQD